MKKSPRVLSYSVAVLAVVVLTVVGIQSRDLLVERYYLYRLGSKDEATRKHAVGRLVALSSVRAVPGIARLFADAFEKEPHRRSFFEPSEATSYAAEALVRIGPQTIPALVEEYLRREARTETLPSDQRPSMAYLYGYTRQTIEAMALEDPKGVIATLSHPHVRVRAFVASGLQELIRTDRQDGTYTNPFARHSDWRHGSFLWGVSDVVPDLIEVLRRPESRVQATAARLLGKIGPKAIAALPQLVRALRTHKTGDAAIAGLVGIGPDVVPAVLALAREGDDRVIERCAKVLAGLGNTVSARYVHALNSDAIALRRCAAFAFAEMQWIPKEAVERIVAVLPELPIKTCWFLGVAFETMKSRASTAVPSLIALIEDSTTNDELRQVAAYALGGIGPAAVSAVPALSEMVKRGDPQQRFWAEHALQSIRGHVSDGEPASNP